MFDKLKLARAFSLYFGPVRFCLLSMFALCQSHLIFYSYPLYPTTFLHLSFINLILPSMFEIGKE